MELHPPIAFLAGSRNKKLDLTIVYIRMVQHGHSVIHFLMIK